MTPVPPLAAVALFVGCWLLLAELRWFRRVPLDQRVAAYLPGRTRAREQPIGVLASLRALATPWAVALGAWLARTLGVTEELAVRLERIHATTSVAAFRLRQLGWSVAAFGAAGVIVAGTAPPPALALLVLVGAPALTYLVTEQRLLGAARRWQRRVFLELPVVSEQLGMLLSAGYSVGAGLNRLAATGTGACARDLQRVCQRMRHGVAEHAALGEWAEVSGVPEVGRLVAVLSLDREASDLGRLITEESRAVRREVHRELIETIERRAQQVWIPVTVATLVPGVLFLVAPFVTAMQLFAGS